MSVIVNWKNDKELIQCLAFAFVAEFKNDKEMNVQSKFVDLISFFITTNEETQNDKEKKQEYPKIIQTIIKNFLSIQFPFNPLISYLKTRKEKDVIFSLKTVYIIAKKLSDKSYMDIRNYRIYTQFDNFMIAVKDKPIINIQKALNLPTSDKLVDLYSSIDVILIKKHKRRAVEMDFKNNFGTEETIIANGLVAGKLYAEKFQKYIDDKTWFPISLKLPGTLKAANNIKLSLISFNRSEAIKDIEIDPYIRFLALLLKNPSQTKTKINALVDIEFSEFNLNLQYWKLPITFNYDKILDTDLKTKLLNYPLSFDLQLLNGSWNGQWSSKTSKNQHLAGYFGGVSISSFENLIKKYPHFKYYITKLANDRTMIFDQLCEKYEKNLVFGDTIKEKNLQKRYNQYKESARKYVGENKFLFGNEFYELQKFTRILDGKLNFKLKTIETEYKINVINYIKKLLHERHVNTLNKEWITGHFNNIQMSYFLFYGGEDFKKFVKKAIVLMLYGWITKKAHITINFHQPNYHVMHNVLEEIIETTVTEKMRKEDKIKYFKTAPHYILT